MSKLFSTEGKLYAGMERIYQILLLNVVFVISCLPLVTIGAALSAAYATAYKMIDFREDVLYKEYFHQFKQNFWPATKLWLGLLAGGVAIFYSLPYLQPWFQGNKIAYFIAMTMVTFMILMVLYLFPLIARFDNSLSATMVNSAILALKHLPISIIVFLVTLGLGVVLPLYLPQLLLVWLFMGSGTIVFINAKLFLKVFSEYENAEEGS